VEKVVQGGRGRGRKKLSMTGMPIPTMRETMIAAAALPLSIAPTLERPDNESPPRETTLQNVQTHSKNFVTDITYIHI
jgi:hypothetical protein